MKDNDVLKELEKKNHELFINKMIIDLENAMDSLLIFYNNYCDTLSSEVIGITNSFLDKSDYTIFETVSKLVTSFFTLYKNNLKENIEKRMVVIKSNIQNIDTFNYEKKLNSESLIIVNQVSDFYQENIYMLIDEMKDFVHEHMLDLKDYFLNSLYLKLMNTLKDKLMYSIKLINNNYDENTTMLKTINAKTLK